MKHNGKSQYSSTFGKRRNVAIVTVGIIAGTATASAFALSQQNIGTNSSITPVASVSAAAEQPSTTSNEQQPEGSKDQTTEATSQPNAHTTVTVNGTAIDVPDTGGSVNQTIPTPGGSVNVQVDTQTSTGSTETFSSGSSSVNVQLNSVNTGNSNGFSSSFVHVNSH